MERKAEAAPCWISRVEGVEEEVEEEAEEAEEAVEAVAAEEEGRWVLRERTIWMKEVVSWFDIKSSDNTPLFAAGKREGREETGSEGKREGGSLEEVWRRRE